MRSLRPIMIYPSYKAAENQSDMMRMKQNDDSLGRDTTLCGDPRFLSLMKGTLFFNEYNMDVEVTSSIFPQPSSFEDSIFPQPSSLSPQPSALIHHRFEVKKSSRLTLCEGCSSHHWVESDVPPVR